METGRGGHSDAKLGEAWESIFLNKISLNQQAQVCVKRELRKDISAASVFGDPYVSEFPSAFGFLSVIVVGVVIVAVVVSDICIV